MAPPNDSNIPSSEARERFAELLSRAAFGKERIVLTRRGKGMAAVIPLEDLDLIERIEDRIDLEEAREALAELEREGSEGWEAVKTGLGL